MNGELTLPVGKLNLIRAAVKHATYTAAYSGAEFSPIALRSHTLQSEAYLTMVRNHQKILRHGANYSTGKFCYARKS